MKLENIFRNCKNSERFFRYKKILFIGSESYDAPTITVLEGLDELGFEIYSIRKPNINSWFCNRIIENPRNFKFDFVLSNLHWGTRWSYYGKYKLKNCLKVLIDGDDSPNLGTWKEKFEYYKKIYVLDPSEDIKMKRIAPYRWVEEMGDYKPDIVFTAQKQFNDKETFYIPFGIHREYSIPFENKSTKEREIDFCHIDGPGIKRKAMKFLLKFASLSRILPGKVFNGFARGEKRIAERISNFVLGDKNDICGWRRWTLDKSYFKILNNSKILIYPGIDNYPFWDSKRPWEAYASGCLVLMEKPCIDVSEYPITEICDFAIYNSLFEFIEKARYLVKNQQFLDNLRKESFEKAKRYFTPKPITRYFLQKTKEKCG